MAVSQLLDAVNAGELSPLLDARTTLEKYVAGCRVLQNFIPTPYGPNLRRPGTALCGAALIDGQSSRLIPFVFNEVEAYVIEISNNLLRMWSSSGDRLMYATERVWATAFDYLPGDLVIDPDFPGSGAVALCLIAHASGTFGADKTAGKWIDATNQDFATPWLSSDLREVQFIQINDLMYFTHPLRPPQLLTRDANAAGDLYFKFVETPWDWPAVLEENVTSDTLTPSATTGSIDITASRPGFFKESHIGAYFQIGHRRTSSSIGLNLVTTGTPISDTIKILGSWTLNTYGTWNAILTVDRSYDNGSTWQTIRSFISNADRNVATTGNEVSEALLRLSATVTSAGTTGSNALLEADDSLSYGLVRITDVNVPGPATLGTVIGMDVVPGLIDQGWSSIQIELVGGGGTGAAAVPVIDNRYLNGKIIGATVTNPGSGYTTAPAVVFTGVTRGFRVPVGFASGVAKIGRDGAIVSTAEVVNDLYDTTATTYWSEGAWSEYQGYPRAIGIHENRVYYAGTSLKPYSFWGSRIDDYQNFRAGVLADDGLFFTVATTRSSVIQWIQSKDGFLHVGSLGNEGRVSSSSPDSALSPGDIQWTPTSSYGSRHLPAIILNDALLFIQGGGRKVRSLAQVPQTDAFTAPDLSALSEHITRGGIVEVAAQNLPEAILWSVRNDGVLLGMSYDSASGVASWHRHVTQGLVESVCVIPGAYGDDVWFSVARMVNGQTRRFIERFSPGWREAWEDEDKPSWWYLDCAKQVVNSPASATVAGLGHLEGCTVGILSDGVDNGTAVVSGGSITMRTPGMLNIVGLPYSSVLRPMKLAMPMQDGTSRARKARLASLNVQVLSSLGCEVSTDSLSQDDAAKQWDAILFRTTDDPMDDSPPVASGEFELVAAGNYSDGGGDLWIRQTAPMPLTVIAIVPVWAPTSN